MARAKIYGPGPYRGASWTCVVRNDAGRIVEYAEVDTHAEAIELACFWLDLMRQVDEMSKEG